MVSWDTLKAPIKGLEGGVFLCATGYPWSFSGEGRLGVAESQTWRIAELRIITTDSLNVISMHEPDRRLQGLSGVEIECPCSSWSLGGSKTRMESFASKDTPSCSNRIMCIPFHFHRAFLL